MKRIMLIAIIILRKSLVRRLKWSATIDINTELTQLPHIEENPIHPAVAWNRALEFSSIVLEIPNDAYTKLSWNLIGCSQSVKNAASWLVNIGKIMRRHLWTLTCPIASYFTWCLGRHICKWLEEPGLICRLGCSWCLCSRSGRTLHRLEKMKTRLSCSAKNESRKCCHIIINKVILT